MSSINFNDLYSALVILNSNYDRGAMIAIVVDYMKPTRSAKEVAKTYGIKFNYKG